MLIKRAGIGTGFWLLTLALVLVAAAILGCANGGSRHDILPSLAGPQAEQAGNLFAQVQQGNEQRQWGRVVSATGAMLDYHRDDPRCGDALVMAVPAALRLGRGQSALDLARVFQSDFPDHPQLYPTLRLGAEMAGAAGDTLTAATFQLMSMELNPAEEATAGGQPAPVPFLSGMSREQLARLADQMPEAKVAGIIGWHQVRALLGEDRRQEAKQLVTTLQSTRPTDPWLQDAVVMVGGEFVRQENRLESKESGQAVLGLLAPLSGRYAGFGNAMSEAARLAVADGVGDSTLTFTLKEMDTGGDPVQAVAAVRALCSQENVDVVVGALTTGSTVAAALVTSGQGIPLVSPTASNTRIETVGPDIFQTNMSDIKELRLLAELSVTLLLKTRVAILGPDTPNGHYLADLMREDVLAAGGQIIAEEFFSPAVTDFRPQILALRQVRPEAVFVPATFEQMALLGPQIDFHHLSCLVLGPSTWSRARPSRQQKASLEGVIFPDAQARFPSSWINSFNVGWDEAAYGAEQTAVALRTYLAVRQTMTGFQAVHQGRSPSLVNALQEKLRGPDGGGPDIDPVNLTEGLLLVRGGVKQPFPSELFAAVFAAAADTIWGESGDDPLVINPAIAARDSLSR